MFLGYRRAMRSTLTAPILLCTALLAGTDIAAAQSILITINEAAQQMTVAFDGKQKYQWLVSTGAPGYDTPSGTFKPFRMEADHFSEEWDDAPMPHSIFFTPEGHAIHGSLYTNRLGRPASHGCVRLAPGNAAILYAMVEKAGLRNTTVVVKNGPSDLQLSELTPPPIKSSSSHKRKQSQPIRPGVSSGASTVDEGLVPAPDGKIGRGSGPRIVNTDSNGGKRLDRDRPDLAHFTLTDLIRSVIVGRM